MLPELLDLANAAERYRSRRKYPKEESLKGSRKLRLPEPLRHLERYIISTFEIKNEEIRYSFGLRKEAISLERPLEFQITEYLAENKKFVAVNQERVSMLAKKWGNSTVPRGDFDLHYFNDILFPTKGEFSQKLRDN